MTEWYDIDWNNDRAELADLEYSEPLPVDELVEPEEPDPNICTCEISEKLCPVHNISDDENEEEIYY